MSHKKELIMVGDRVLIQPDKDQDKTPHGLYLPQGVHEKEKIQGGTIVKIGPGFPMVDPRHFMDENWNLSSKLERDASYIPLQARTGDYAYFLRNAAIEIHFDAVHYLIVPHSAILILIRDPIHDALKKIINTKHKA